MGTISDNNLDRALELNQIATGKGLRTDVQPSFDGGILLVFYGDSYCLEFVMEGNGTVTFTYSVAPGEHDDPDVWKEIEYHEGLSFDEAMMKLENQLW